MDYESRYCDNCIHFEDERGPYACPILNLHYEYNYDQCGKGKTAKVIKKVLDTLIPSDDNGFPTACPTFHPKEDVPAGYVEHLQDGKDPMEFLIK